MVLTARIASHAVLGEFCGVPIKTSGTPTQKKFRQRVFKKSLIRAVRISVDVFAVPSWPKQPLFLQKRRITTMTILTGIISESSIILAADSMWADSQTGAISYVDKINIVNFGKDEVLISQAGSYPVTCRVVQKITEKAKAIQIESAATVAQIAEDSVREVKMDMDEDQKSFNKQWGASLLLAFYANGSPHLCTLEVFGSGILTPAETHYTTGGIGATLANYLFAEHSEPNALEGVALVTSIYIVKKVKENNAYCRGDTSVKWLTLAPASFNNAAVQYAGRATRPLKQFINWVEERLSETDKKTKESRNKEIHTILSDFGHDVWAAHFAQFKQEIFEQSLKHLPPIENPPEK